MIYALIVIVIVIITIITFYSNIHALMGGFWQSTPEFCQESGLNVFCLYIGDNIRTPGKRHCYILAQKSGGEFIMNEPITAQFSLNLWTPENWTPNVHGTKHFDVIFSEELNCPTFPNHQKARFYPICNKIVLYAGDTITAVFYKNSAYTELKAKKNEDESDGESESDEL